VSGGDFALRRVAEAHSGLPVVEVEEFLAVHVSTPVGWAEGVVRGVTRWFPVCPTRTAGQPWFTLLSEHAFDFLKLPEALRHMPARRKAEGLPSALRGGAARPSRRSQTFSDGDHLGTDTRSLRPNRFTGASPPQSSTRLGHATPYRPRPPHRRLTATG
jgi:hypothetical protein